MSTREFRINVGLRVAGLLLALGFVVVTPAPAAPKDPFPDIRVLSVDIGDGVLHPTCTVFPTLVNGYTVWITDSHCVEDGNGDPMISAQFYIGDLKAALHSVNYEKDLASLVGPNVAKGYPIATEPPKFGDPVTVLGHPFAEPVVFRMQGFVVNPGVYEPGGNDGKWTHYAVFQVPAVGGMSGSPILNKKGEVVSVVQFTWGRGFQPVCGGAFFHDLTLFVLSR